MSQILLYDAKIQENFLKAVRFYEKAPTFLILNMRIKPEVFDVLDHIRIVAFSKSDFINTFKSKNTSSGIYETNDLLKFSSNKNQHKLVSYYSKNFGFGFYNSYRNINKTSALSNTIIDINKNDMYIEKSNLYALFITVKDTYELLEKETNSEENAVYFKVYIKDKNKNVIWTSPVITSPTKINDLITNASVRNEFKYLKYFIKNDLQSAVLSITDFNNLGQKFLKINFPSGIASESLNNITGKRLSENSNGDIVGLFGTSYDRSIIGNITDKSREISVSLSCKYNDTNLLERFSNTNFKKSSLYNFDRQFVQFSLNNVYEEIIENYYNNQNNFDFTLSLNVSVPDDMGYTIPDHTVTVNRSSELISSIENNFRQNFIRTKKDYLSQISISYKNINTRIIQHKIDISEVFDKLTQIKLDNLKDSFAFKNTIYLSIDNSNTLGNVLQISSVENLLDLKNRVLEIEEGNKLIFYTTTLNDQISNNKRFTYTFKYYINNNFEITQEIIGEQTYNADLDKINYRNKTIETNKIFKESLIVDIDKTNLNLNLSSENPMILNLTALNLNSVDRFDELRQFFGYDSVKEFLASCLVKFNYIIKISKNNITFRQDENYTNSGTVGYFEKIYNFSELFRLNDNDGIATNDNIVSNLTFYSDLKNSPFNDLVQIKRSGIFDFIFADINPKDLSFKFHKINNPRASIVLSYDMTLYPIPALLSKYKNKGLDETKNVLNVFNNDLEAESVDKLFYDYIYDENTRESFSSYIKIKESFFNPNTSLNQFYEFIAKNMLGKNILPPLDFVNLRNRSFDSLINDVTLNDPIYNTIKAEFYVNRMFESQLRLQGFPFTQNAITRSKNDLNINDIVYYIPEFLKFDFDVVKSIKRINTINGIQNVGSRFVNLNLLDDPKTVFEVRFALVPLTKLDDNNTLNNNEKNEIKAQSRYLDIISEGNTTLLKPNANFYSSYQETQTWNGLLFNSYNKYGEDSYALTLDTQDNQLLNHINYKNYFSDFFNESLRFNFTKLHDMRLNVALLITTPNIINQESDKDYWCDYYQISLLNNENVDYEIGMLNTIQFVQNV